jgi:hypothetical protein
MAGQPDVVTFEGWRSLQLDVQVRYPSNFSPSARDLQTLPTARFNIHHSRRTRPHLTDPVRTAQPIWPEQSEPASHGAHRGASTCTRPPSEAVLVRRSHRWPSQDRQASPVFPGARNPTRCDFLLLPFLPPRSKAEFIAARFVQTLWHPVPDNPQCRRDTCSMECSSTTASPHVEGTIRSTCSTRTHMVALEKVGCTLTMKV